MSIMKNIVCPISDDRISDNIPRIVASFVISLLVIYIVTGYQLILAFLVVDFALRSSSISHYSPLGRVAMLINNGLKLKGKIIDKAPKIFAARLGFALLSTALVLDVVTGSVGAPVIAAMVALFAGLECVLNFCLGCIIYSYLIIPFYSQKHS